MKAVPLLISLVLLLTKRSLGYSFISTPEAKDRQAKFDQEVAALWEQFGEDEDDQTHIVAATTFGDGDTNIYGKGLNSTKGIQFHAFQGIQYASAPRFQPPIQLDQYWTDSLEAKEQKEICPQDGGRGEQAEECLFLSIYSSKLPQELEDEEEMLPVMIFIHGGSFTSGSSNAYLPFRLLNHDIVLVTINYRLGTLGFFTLNNEEAPGNYALYDQREAIRWVHNHISDFGGDKNRVTVFGQSAGSVSTSYMTLLADNGTIHGAISESGSTMEVWSLDSDPYYASRYVSDYVGCYEAATDYINMECMRLVDYELLVNATTELVNDDRKNGMMGFRGVSPTIQPDVEGAILTMHPSEYYKQGLALDIPYILGVNKQEGSYIVYLTEYAFLRPNHLLYNVSYLREGLVTQSLSSFGVQDGSHGITDTMELLYCEGVDLGDFYASAPCLVDMTGVMLLRAGGWKTANFHSAFTSKETYFYNFDYDDGPSLSFWLYGPNPPYDPGVTHGDELIYLFIKPVPPLTGEELLIQDRMTLLWTNFATYGEPTPDEDQSWKDLDIAKWIPYHFEDHHFLLMRNDYIMQKEFPLRWTISMDEIRAGQEVTYEPPFYTTEMTTAIYEDPENSEADSPDPEGPHQSGAKVDAPSVGSGFKTQEDVEAMEDKRDAYMITMIVFIVAFVVAESASLYFFIKMRRNKTV